MREGKKERQGEREREWDAKRRDIDTVIEEEIPRGIQRTGGTVCDEEGE